MANKSNIRSMRFSDEIIEMIESQAGETFTAKFEALVTKCVWELPQKEKQLKYIEEQIERQKKRLSEIEKQANAIGSKMNDFKYSLQNMEYQINRAVLGFKEITKEK